MAILFYYEGIEGETADQNHLGWIDVSSWAWGAKRKITSNSSTRGDRESSNVTISDLRIDKYMDSASLKLFLETCCGTGKTAKLRLTKSGTGGGGDVFMEYILKNAHISEYLVGVDEDDIKRPMESLTISFVDIEVRYTPYDNDGVAMAALAGGYDTATNSKK